MSAETFTDTSPVDHASDDPRRPAHKVCPECKRASTTGVVIAACGTPYKPKGGAWLSRPDLPVCVVCIEIFHCPTCPVVFAW